MIFYITALLLTMLMVIGKPNTILNNKYMAYYLIALLVSISTYSIGMRKYSPGTDSYNYLKDFLLYQNLSFFEAYSLNNRELLFFSFQWLTAQVTTSPILFNVFVWLIFVFIFLKALKNILTPYQILLVFISYTLFFIFSAYVLVALRQGIAISLILLAISYLITDQQKNNKKKILIVLTLASLTHWTAIPFAIMILLLKLNKLKLSYVIFSWVMSAILFVLGLNATFLGVVSRWLPQLEHYSSISTISHYGAVNRIDFLLFSLIWMLLGLFFYYFNKEEKYKLILMVYISFNTLFLLFGFIAFSDRLAAYSWFLIPLIIWFPLFLLKKYNFIIVTGCLAIFTLSGIFTGSIDSLFP